MSKIEISDEEKLNEETTSKEVEQEEECSTCASEDVKNEKASKKERELKWAKKAKEDAEAAKEAESEKAAEKEKAALDEANEKYTRLFAEFDNFRKRSEKEKSQMFGMGAKDVIEKILPVVDSLEAGLNALKEGEKESPFAEGMDKTYKMLMNILTGLGVEAIESEGKEFDPEKHNAVMHVDDESLGENVVAEELQKGYMYKGQVVRYAMVKVAN